MVTLLLMISFSSRGVRAAFQLETIFRENVAQALSCYLNYIMDKAKGYRDQFYH